VGGAAARRIGNRHGVLETAQALQRRPMFLEMV
jgi:hypothetical protein